MLVKNIIHNARTSDELIEARKNYPNKKRRKQIGKVCCLRKLRETGTARKRRPYWSKDTKDFQIKLSRGHNQGMFNGKTLRIHSD